MTAPQRSHLDPDMLALLDDIRRRLHGLFNVSGEGIAFAVPGTGSSGLEAAVANVVQDGYAVLCVVTGYFGDRLAQVCERYGANVTRLTGEWGRAIDPQQVRTALEHASFKAVTIVHAETSTGVLQPVQAVAALAR
jgi:alanine-glyoxylate transaminase/serine-glyoxylate transaminase/serine-pyruvate transaminase